MLKKIKKPLCLLLVALMAVPMFVGCSDEEESDIPTIVPELQIFADEYRRDETITEYVSYRTTFIKPKKDTAASSIFEKMEIFNLYQHFDVQVDNWECVTVGVTTMGEIAAIVDAVNDKYVEENEAAIIAERQAVIDAEYEAAVKKAAEKGKTYDKPKKEVITDDIHFDEPYTYTVTLGTNKKAVPEEYKGTLLVDPDTYKVIFFDVAKYGIPYVRFEFEKVNDLYNNRITQESDWVMNGVCAADVSSYAMSEDGETPLENPPSFVDVDGKNKAAKQNMYFSGDVSFAGEGFNWDSLWTLVDALELVENEKRGGFVQSSDDNFVYYTMTLHTDIFELRETIDYEAPHFFNFLIPSDFDYSATNYMDKMAYPCTRLIATFDPLTQSCVNWTIDMHTTSEKFSNKRHEFSERLDANIHEYKVDTNDYEGMRQSIKDWIKENAVPTTTAYCALDNNKIFGIVENGIGNVTIEATIDGVVYECQSFSWNGDGSLIGTYVKADALKEAEAMEDANDAQKLINKNTKQLTIACCVLDEEGNIIGRMVEGMTQLYLTNGKTYYIADYEKTESGFKDVRVFVESTIEKLFSVYAKVYRLTEAQYAELQAVYGRNGIMAMRTYVDELFAEAEKAKKEEESKNPNWRLNNIVFDGKKLTLSDLTSKKVIAMGFEYAGFYQSQIGATTYSDGEYTSLYGYGHLDENDNEIVVCEQNDVVYFIKTNSDRISIGRDIKVGMTRDELMKAIGEKPIVESGDEHLIEIVDADYSLFISIDMFTETVEGIVLVHNSYFSNFDADAYQAEVDAELDAELEELMKDPKIQALLTFNSGYATEINTEDDLSQFRLEEIAMDIDDVTHVTFEENGFAAAFESESSSEFENIKVEIKTVSYRLPGAESEADAGIHVCTKPDGNIVNSVICTDGSFIFFGGLRVGMSKDEAMGVMGENVENVADVYLVLKSNDHILFASLNDELIVSEIRLIKTAEYFSTTN